MASLEKIRIRRLGDKSGYALWRIHVIAKIGAKGYADALDQDIARSCSVETRRRASNIIVSTLSDKALRVVRSVVNETRAMLDKLDSRNNSETVASRIAKMSDFVGTRYSSLGDDMSAHVAVMAALIEQLRGMGITFDDTLAVGILVSSLDVTELAPVAALIETLLDDSLS